MSPQLSAAAVVAVTLCLGVSVAHGTEITFTVTGTVTTAQASGSPVPFPNLAVGDHFSVSVSYNDASCGVSFFFTCTQNLAKYLPDTASITDGAVTYPVPTNGFQSNVTIFNDTTTTIGTLGDEITVSLSSVGPTIDFALQLIGSTQPLTSPTVPVSNPGSLPGWDPNHSTMSFGFDNPNTLGSPITQSFSGPLDVVPEPGVLSLVALGLGFLAAIRARAT